MAWLRITGVVLFIAGMVGVIVAPEPGGASLALCVAGIVAWGAALIAQRRRGKRDSTSDGGNDDELKAKRGRGKRDSMDDRDDDGLLDGFTDFGGHDSHDRVHDHDRGHDADWGHDGH